MEQLTDKIASISLSSVVLILVLLTAARWSLHASRAAVLRGLADLMESAILAIALVFLVLRPFVLQSFFIPTGSMQPTLWEGDHILVNKWLYRMRPPERGEVIVFRAPKEAAPDEKEFIKRLIGVPGDVIEVREGFVEIQTRPRPTVYTRSEIRLALGERLTVDQMASGNLPALRLTADAIFLGGRRFSKEEFARLTNRPGLPVRIQPGKVLRNDRMLNECYVAEDAQYHLSAQTIPPGHLFVMGDNRNQSHDSHIWGMLPMNRVVGRAELIFWPFSHFKRITP